MTALTAGDVESLLALSDVKAIYEDALACESTEMETKAVEQRLRNAFRQPAANSKGMKIEVLAVDDLERDADQSFETGKRQHGCTARVDVDVHRAKVKVKVTKDNEIGETTIRVGLVEVDERWYLRDLPTHVQAGGKWKPVIARMSEFADRMCKCKDEACGEAVESDYYAWLREWTRQNRDEEDNTPEEDVMTQLSEISRRFSSCQMNLSSGGAP